MTQSSNTIYRYDPKKRLVYKTLSYRNLHYLIPDGDQLLILHDTIQESMNPKQRKLFQRGLLQVSRNRARCLVACDQSGRLTSVILYKLLQRIPPGIPGLKKEKGHRNLMIQCQLVMLPSDIDTKEHQRFEQEIIKTNIDYLLESYAPCTLWIGVPENDQYITILTDDGFIPAMLQNDAIFLYKQKLL